MIGKSVLHYKILSKLGQGGMGVVYQAEDTRLGRRVAIKFLPTHSAMSDEDRQRFQIEAKAAAALNHANIATIHAIEEYTPDAADGGDTELFLVMEYIEGRELKELVRGNANPSIADPDALDHDTDANPEKTSDPNVRADGNPPELPAPDTPRRDMARHVPAARHVPPDPDASAAPLQINRILAYAAQIAAGLRAAHAKEIVHRDIKSSNIMVTDEDQIKIMDFGLAKISGGVTVTETGATLGTVAYMSPEQIQGLPADHRSDIWSFGAVLYEMLTGSTPFPGEFDHAVMYAILHEDTPPVADRRPDVPDNLKYVVEKSLAKDPDDRYQSVDALLEDLQYDATAPFAGAPVPKPARKRTSRLAAIWPALAVVVAGAAIAGYFFLGSDAASTERIPIAVADFVNHTQETELDGLSELLATSLEQSRRLSVLPRASMYGMLTHLDMDSVTSFDEPLVRQVCARANVNTMATASIRKLGRTYIIDLKILDIEKDQYLLTTNERAQGLENIPPMLDELALKIRRGLQEQENELTNTRRPVATNLAQNMEAYNHFWQGMQLYYQGDHRSAQDQFQQAIAVDSTFGLAYVRLATLAGWDATDFDLELAVRKGFEYIDSVPDKERFLLRAMAASLNEGPFVAAMQTQGKVLIEMEKRYPDDKDMLFLLGDAYFHTKQHEKGLPYFLKAYEIDPNNSNTLVHLVETYRELGDYAAMRRISEHWIEVSGGSGYGFLVEALALSGETAAGVDRLTKEWAVRPDRWRFPSLLFRLHILDENLDAAETVLDSMTTLAGGDTIAGPGFRERGQLYLYRGQYRKAIAALDVRLQNYVDRGRKRLVQAGSISKARMLNLGWGDRKSVREAIEFAIRNGYTENTVLLEDHVLVGGPRRTGRAPDSLLAGQLNKFSPEWINIHKIMVHVEEGDCDRAIQTAETVLENRELRHCFPFLYDLSLCYLEKNRPEAAIEALTNLQKRWHYRMRQFYYPKSFYGLGRAYEQQADTARAVEQYGKFLELWKNADQNLPELIDAKARFANLGGTSR